MDILLERILSLIPRKPDGKFVHGAISKFGKSIGYSGGEVIAQWMAGQSDSYKKKVNQIADTYNVSAAWLMGETNEKDRTTASSGGVWIPVLGKVAAGIPITAVQDVEDYEEISADMASRGEYFALRIRGDSMEPRIKDGDVVIVRVQQDCNDGDVAVVLVDGESATVKRVKKRPEGLMLIPNNTAYEPMFYSNEDIEALPVTIIGKVVELRGKF